MRAEFRWMGSNMVRADFGSGLICPRAQTCCALKSSAPFGAREDNCADLLGLQTRRGSNQSAAYVGESNSRSNVFQIRRVFVCVSSRWKVLSGEFRRRPTELVIKFRKSDRVGRRGLSEPGGIFSRLLTYAFPWLNSGDNQSGFDCGHPPNCDRQENDDWKNNPNRRRKRWQWQRNHNH